MSFPEPLDPSELIDARLVKSRSFRHAFDIREFGLSGKGETNEFPALQAMLDKLPDRATVIVPTPNFKIGLYQTPEIRNKTGLTLLSPIKAADDAETDDGVQLLWGGSAGERVLGIYDSKHLRLGGFTIHGGNAGVGIDIDQTPKNKTTCTANTFKRLQIIGGAGVQNWVCMRVSETAKSNVEYIRVFDSIFKGNGGTDTVTSGLDASIEQGSDRVHFAVSTFTPAVLGSRLCLARATSDPRFSGGLLDARVKAFIDEHTLQLDQPAAQRAADTRWMLGEGYGSGFSNGDSFNAKRQELYNCEFKALKTGIDSKGGSVRAYSPNFVYCDMDWNIQGSQSNSTKEVDGESEGSRIHVVLGTQYRFVMTDTRVAMQNCCPGTGMIQPQYWGGGPVKMEGGGFEGDVPPGSSVYELAYAAGIGMQSEGVRYPYNYGLRELGFADASKSLFPRGCYFESVNDIQSGRLVFKGGHQMFGNPPETQ